MTTTEKKKKRLMVLDTRLLSSRALSAGRLQLRGLRLVAVLLACFVLPCLLLVVLQPSMGAALSVLVTLQSAQTRLHIQQAVEAEISGSSHRPVAETRILVKEEDEEKQTNFPSAAKSANEIPRPLEENKSIESSGSANVISSPPPVEENKSMEAVVGTEILLKEEDKESKTSNSSPETVNEISPPVQENKSMEDAMHAEETKVPVLDQETKSEESVAVSDAPIADAELNSPIHQDEMKSQVSDQTGTEEKDMKIMGKLNAELNSSPQQEETKLPVPDQETETEEKNTIIFGEIIADNAETNSSTPQEGIERQNAELVSVPLIFTNTQRGNMSVAGAGEAVVNSETEVPVDKHDSSNSPAGNLDAETTNVHCDFSQERSDTCSVRGDVRVDGRSSSITVASDQSSTPGGNSLPTSRTIRPYSRKWEPQLMDRIREFSVKTTSDETRPRCTVNHTAPAVLFSTGGFVGNFFHDFTDVLIPLFITSRQYQGEVHFLVSDFNNGWISKYSPILGRLSRHPVVNVDDDENVHCFPQVHVGLLSHKELGVDPSKAPEGQSVSDFRELLRMSYSLRRRSVGTIAGRKPRLLIMLRKGSRAFSNARRVVSMGKRSGFKVVTAGPEDARELSRFARVVNSCDVMMGVHGAGLTNMVFLPEGASVIQILPWGGLHYACWHDFGAPAPDMGLNYFEYDIREKESSLIKRYSRDDPVFKDPLSIHKGGFGAIWSVFLKDQTVKLDVARFKNVLQQALQAVH